MKMMTSESRPKRERTVPCRTSCPSPCTPSESGCDCTDDLLAFRNDNRDQKPEDLDLLSFTDGNCFDSLGDRSFPIRIPLYFRLTPLVPMSSLPQPILHRTTSCKYQRQRFLRSCQTRLVHNAVQIKALISSCDVPWLK